jgi:hypothetical protein
MLKDEIEKKNQLEKEKKLESTELTRQTCSLSCETGITL